HKKSFDKYRKEGTRYTEGMLVAIKRTQHGPGLKLHAKFLGLYHVHKILRNDRYLVEKVGEHEGPRSTTTSTEYMKPWSKDPEAISSDSEDD
ncbi:hypothetical protein WN55_01195, partial [Dufourea novaeangliae]